MTTIRLDLIVHKNPEYGDEPRYWDWPEIGAATFVKGVRVGFVPSTWTATCETPAGWETHFLSLTVEFTTPIDFTPDIGWAEWFVEALERAVCTTARGMQDEFTLSLFAWAKYEEATGGLKTEPAPEWPFKTDVVPVDRIIPGGLTVHELNELIRLLTMGDDRTEEEEVNLIVLTARYDGKDPVDGVAGHGLMYSMSPCTKAAITWLVDQIPSRTKEG